MDSETSKQRQGAVIELTDAELESIVGGQGALINLDGLAIQVVSPVLSVGISAASVNVNPQLVLALPVALP